MGPVGPTEAALQLTSEGCFAAGQIVKGLSRGPCAVGILLRSIRFSLMLLVFMHGYFHIICMRNSLRHKRGAAPPHVLFISFNVLFIWDLLAYRYHLRIIFNASRPPHITLVLSLWLAFHYPTHIKFNNICYILNSFNLAYRYHS